MRTVRCRTNPGFTLLQLVATVAVVLLLLSIGLPAAVKVQESTRRTMCVENMHRLMEGMLAYAGEHQSKGPMRGWFSYTVTETGKEAGWGARTEKVMVNLGMLHKRFNGGDYNTLYCPSTYTTIRDGPFSGWSTAFDPVVPFTVGGYNYATILQQRTFGAPVLGGGEPFPSQFWSSGLRAWIQQEWQPRHPGVTFRLPANPCLVSDLWIGGLRPVHGSGINVLYTDGHTRYHDISDVTVSSSSMGQFDIWHRISVRQ